MTHLLSRHQRGLAYLEEANPAWQDLVAITLAPMQSATRARSHDGREILLFGTNNYLGLTYDRDCLAAAQAALQIDGTGMTGSRLANGTSPAHRELEAKFARYYDCDEAIIFSTGYQANLALISALAGSQDRIFLDADSHASLYDAAVLSGARLIRFRHNDADDLARRLKRSSDEPGNKLIIIEGLYSMFGDCAPIADLVAVKNQYGATLICDEAHSFGVYGDGGRGVASEAGYGLDGIDYLVGTFSKSLAGTGGFAVSRDPSFSLLRFISRPYIYTAAQAPAMVASVSVALDKIIHGDDLRERLWHSARIIYEGLTAQGFRLGADMPGPIAAVRCGDMQTAMRWWQELFAMGLYVNCVVPPGAPNNESLLRCSLSAAHDEDEIATALACFSRLRR